MLRKAASELAFIFLLILSISQFVTSFNLACARIDVRTDHPIDAMQDSDGFLSINGTELCMAGERFYAIGANHIPLIYSFMFPDSIPENGVEIIEDAHKWHVNVLRFSALTYIQRSLTETLEFWRANNETFWSCYDKLVGTASENHVYLVPSLVWDQWTAKQLSAVTGEEPRQLFVPNSATNNLFKTFVKELVTRYSNETTILMWELGNELNLFCERGPNFYDVGGLHTFVKDTVDYIRQLDSNHLVESGMAEPAYDQGRTLNDAVSSFVLFNKYVDVAGIHMVPKILYGQPSIEEYYGVSRRTYINSLLEASRTILKKPMIIGEIGDDLESRPQSEFNIDVLEISLELKVPLSLIWEWETKSDADSFSQTLNVSPAKTPLMTYVLREYSLLAEARKDLTTHNPIKIAGNRDFTYENGVIAGSGTASDPYVIANWEIDGNGGNGIYIKNTEAHFVIINVWVYNSSYGIRLENVSNGILCRSTMTNDENGIYSLFTSNTTLKENRIISNSVGISLNNSSRNSAYHNNLIVNANQVASLNSTGAWDVDYPDGGNYWSDYAGFDLNHSIFQNITGCDGIGDTAYVIDSRNQDNYPLTEAWNANEKLARLHDIEITDVTSSKNDVGQGYCSNINVTVRNQGNTTETFKVSACANAIGPTDMLVGHWKFDESCCTRAIDSSANENYGTLVNGPKRVDGKSGKALSFDGINDYVEIPDIQSLRFTDDFSIALWVNPSVEIADQDDYSHIIDKFNSTFPRTGWTLNAIGDADNPAEGKLQFVFFDSDGNARNILSTETNPTPEGLWTHIAITYNEDIGTLKLYINGLLDNTAIVGSRTVSTTRLPLRIGASSDWLGGNFFNGTIDDVRIYNGTLSEEQIREIACSSLIQTKTFSLTSEDSLHATFTWNTTGFAEGNYSIDVCVTPLSEEAAISNFISYKQIVITIPGDINADGVVNILDISVAAKSYGSSFGEDRWDFNSDINEDGTINILDISAIAKEYGKIRES